MGKTTLATRQEFPLYRGVWAGLAGRGPGMQGQGETGLTQLRQGLAAVAAPEQTLSRPLCLVLLTEAAGQVGHVEEGLRLLGEALAAREASVARHQGCPRRAQCHGGSKRREP